MAKVVQLRGTRPGGWAKERWDWIRAVMAAPGISPTTKLVAVTLAQGFANHETGECRPGLAALMAATGAARRTVLLALADLRAAGWIEPKGGNAPGKLASYVFRWPGQVQTPAPEQVQKPAPEQVQETAPTGARNDAPPIPPYKAEPNMNQNRYPRSATKIIVPGGVRPTPNSQIVQPGSVEETEWEAWFFAKGFPPLAKIGRRVGVGMVAGWDMPTRWPPSPSDETATAIALRFASWLRSKA